MKALASKSQRELKKQRIRDNFFEWGWSVRRLQKKYKYKSAKSIYNILYPDRFNKYQQSRYHAKKLIA